MTIDHPTLMEILLITILSLQLKHFLVDFYLQTDSQVREKGYLNKPGGYIHALQHGVITFLIVLGVTGEMRLAVSLGLVFDTVMHYVIDYTKMRIGRITGHTPKDKGFWIAIGLDQMAHQIVYAIIVVLVIQQLLKTA